MIYSFLIYCYRKRIQSQLQCHSFDWYLEHVMKELYVPEDHFTIKGQIKSKLKSVIQDKSYMNISYSTYKI